ncbi:MAG: inner membrane CreD family protein [Candidatus Margulisbacteria bacterium]|nr:inner membrane CreD family protein [Candidatus Margulisiibacteriota bacterium]
MTINNNSIQSISPLVKGRSIRILPDKSGKIKINIHYLSNGMEHIKYVISKNTLSPTKKQKAQSKYMLIWDLDKAVTGKNIGLIIPSKLNPGDIVGRVSFFAPVSLLFFFVVLLIFSVLKNTNLHPMHYFFLAATFFSFHLMYSYFSDHINIFIAFFIAAFISLFLTTSYLIRFTSIKFSMFAAFIQFIYLIVFSYSFFFKGVTGLIVTIAAVITLFILMQLTAKVKWDTIFNKA